MSCPSSGVRKSTSTKRYAALPPIPATAVAGIGGIAAYLLVLVLLRTPELGQLMGVLRRRAVAADI